MKKLHVYDVYLDDGRDCFKVTVPAENKKDAEAFTAGNGEVIATGGEVYNTIASVKNGIASVVKNAPVANLEDQTIEGFKSVSNPKFEIFKNKSGEFRFRLKAKNGEIIAASEGYVKKDSCKKGIASVRKNAADSIVIEPEPDKK